MMAPCNQAISLALISTRAESVNIPVVPRPLHRGPLMQACSMDFF